MNKSIEYVYCEGGPLDGQFHTVTKTTKFFNVTLDGVDFGNGPQQAISHYERTKRLKTTTQGDFFIFYSNSDWDR